MNKNNLDLKTVESFGDEWSRFDQTGMVESEARKAFDEYFSVFPWDKLPADAQGFDMGCGSGRWARFVASRVGHLNCVDPSAALEIARATLIGHDNVSFFEASVDDSGLPVGSQDFGYSLGVLHHVPDTSAAIKSCTALLKKGAPLLLYLYYNFDNRPFWFRALWQITDAVRRVIRRLPPVLKHGATDTIAALVYWPLARISGLLEIIRVPVHAIPLSFYRHHTFYTMRTDSRDRFGTPLEQRFTKTDIEHMMRSAGLTEIKFSDQAPYWCVVGFKA
jgi:SAM-dependent methyltransferase